jgi:WXG100 family type VII secretion target
MDWHGSAREEYWQYQMEWDAAVNELNALLNRIGGTVGQINQNYLDTEMQIKRRWATR